MVPLARAVGAVPAILPAWSYVILVAACWLSVRVTMLTLASAHRELSASPLKPNVSSSCALRLAESFAQCATAASSERVSLPAGLRTVAAWRCGT